MVDGVINQGVVPFRLSGVERLLQDIDHEVSLHRPTDQPAEDAPGKDVGDKGNIDEALPSPDG